ncbi:ester cyclase [Streptomyces flavotricini]|uniref:Ester cyclase n=1 Tax=Streptomyces flavotricini TaxID=66888 RepID=A0ABS8EGK8_9ACTN|nr:nuclear transport factor 2 family protein [Streptomyces flavotricini]MCC0100287.1 ester cyclase [Streptomyces flavotricini]
MHLTTQPPTAGAALPNRESGTRLLEGWTALWNGDLALAEQIIDPGFRLRFANAVEGTGADSTLERSTLLTFIAAHRQALTGLTYDLDGPPVIDAAHGQLATRWAATYVDGSGTPVTKSGIDMFSITDGRISAVWSLTGDRRFAA